LFALVGPKFIPNPTPNFDDAVSPVISISHHSLSTLLGFDLLYKG
jgi:hypothetical protein